MPELGSRNQSQTSQGDPDQHLKETITRINKSGFVPYEASDLSFPLLALVRSSLYLENRCVDEFSGAFSENVAEFEKTKASVLLGAARNNPYLGLLRDVSNKQVQALRGHLSDSELFLGVIALALSPENFKSFIQGYSSGQNSQAGQVLDHGMIDLPSREAEIISTLRSLASIYFPGLNDDKNKTLLLSAFDEKLGPHRVRARKAYMLRLSKTLQENGLTTSDPIALLSLFARTFIDARQVLIARGVGVVHKVRGKLERLFQQPVDERITVLEEIFNSHDWRGYLHDYGCLLKAMQQAGEFAKQVSDNAFVQKYCCTSLVIDRIGMDKILPKDKVDQAVKAIRESSLQEVQRDHDLRLAKLIILTAIAFPKAVLDPELGFIVRFFRHAAPNTDLGLIAAGGALDFETIRTSLNRKVEAAQAKESISVSELFVREKKQFKEMLAGFCFPPHIACNQSEVAIWKQALEEVSELFDPALDLLEESQELKLPEVNAGEVEQDTRLDEALALCGRYLQFEENREGWIIGPVPRSNTEVLILENTGSCEDFDDLVLIDAARLLQELDGKNWKLIEVGDNTLLSSEWKFRFRRHTSKDQLEALKFCLAILGNSYHNSDNDNVVTLNSFVFEDLYQFDSVKIGATSSFGDKVTTVRLNPARTAYNIQKGKWPEVEPD